MIKLCSDIQAKMTWTATIDDCLTRVPNFKLLKYGARRQWLTRFLKDRNLFEFVASNTGKGNVAMKKRYPCEEQKAPASPPITTGEIDDSPAQNSLPVALDTTVKELSKSPLEIAGSPLKFPPEINQATDFTQSSPPVAKPVEHPAVLEFARPASPDLVSLLNGNTQSETDREFMVDSQCVCETWITSFLVGSKLRFVVEEKDISTLECVMNGLTMS
ncbi:hypothetical protein PHMEG_00023137 [Phytophthora megakarya]|uniref:Uncharacterized protein n=1 Tax=Phytophthora megakarya TaxID=4795 RepID=A0A225VHR8_9STRA|nr:hypothetical protein PHMEG_00023137 [Phytophthora megakarya]